MSIAIFLWIAFVLMIVTYAYQLSNQLIQQGSVEISPKLIWTIRIALVAAIAATAAGI